MSGALRPAQLAKLAEGNLGSLRALLSGLRTRGTSLAAQLDARLDTEKQDTLLTWAARRAGPRATCRASAARSGGRAASLGSPRLALRAGLGATRRS